MEKKIEIKFFDVENDDVDVRDLAFPLQNDDIALIDEAIDYSLKLLRDDHVQTYRREDNILITEIGYYVAVFSE